MAGEPTIVKNARDRLLVIDWNGMPTYKTQGIIIKRKNYGEADRLLTLYTQNDGKIVVIAKGVRRSKAKMVGHTELFYLQNFQLAEGKTWDIVAGAEIIKDFANIRSKSKLTNRAYFLAELVDSLTHESEPHKEIFDLLQSSLTKLDRERNKLVLAYFSFKILSFLGHKPELNNCVKCRQKISPDINYFSNLMGGILCNNCCKSDLGSIRIGVPTIKIIRLFDQCGIDLLDKLTVDDKISKELGGIMINFTQYILEKPIKSIRFL